MPKFGNTTVRDPQTVRAMMHANEHAACDVLPELLGETWQEAVAIWREDVNG